MIQDQKKSVGVLMPAELYRKVKEQAEKTNRTVPGYIRRALKCYLWHVENAPETLTKEWET